MIGDLWPGNTSIDSWLTAYNNGTANVPTAAQIAQNIAIQQKSGQAWSFGNPPLPNSSANGFNPSSLAPTFHALWTALGLNPPPLAPAPPAPAPNTGSVAAPIGGSVNALASQSTVPQVGSTTTSTKATGDVTKSEPPQVSGTPQGGAATPPAQGGEVTPPTTGLPPLTGPKTPTGTNPSTGTGGIPGSLLSGVNKLLPHSSGTNTTNSGTNPTNSGTNTANSGTDTTHSGTDTSNHPGNASSTGTSNNGGSKAGSKG
jgi:hypothetical protein